jgi:hypothetical protein
MAFVYGWAKARPWNMNNLMTVWTVAVVIDVLAGVVDPAPLQSVRAMLHY